MNPNRRNAVQGPEVPRRLHALSPSRCLPPHLSPYQVRPLPVGVSLPSSTHSFPLSSALFPSRCLPPPDHSHSQARSLPVGVFLHTIPTISSAPSPSRHLPPPLIPFLHQMRSLPVGISLPNTIPTISSALSPSRCLPPPHHSHSQVRPLPVGVSLLHLFPSIIKCALSQSVSPTLSPFPSTLKIALSQSVSS